MGLSSMDADDRVDVNPMMDCCVQAMPMDILLEALASIYATFFTLNSMQNNQKGRKTKQNESTMKQWRHYEIHHQPTTYLENQQT